MRALAIVALVAAGCGSPSAPVKVAPPAPAAEPPAEPRRPPPPQVARFSIGALAAFALKDGDLHEKNDGQTFGLGHAPTEIDALLGGPTPTIDLSIQPLLVRDGERILLFDTGARRPAWAPGAGALLASLALADVAPDRITDIFVSHHHDDHVGGLVDAGGALAFPNARIHMSAPEWKAMQETKDQADLVAVIAMKVVPFQPGAELVPSVRAVRVDGHTPGHSAYEIRSGASRLLYLGDAAHHSVISVRRPRWPVDYDEDKPLAAASRATLLERAAAQRLRVYGVHFPFPGLGTIARTPDGLAFIAESAPPAAPSPGAAASPAATTVDDDAWRVANGVTAWPPAQCTRREGGQLVDACQCTRTVTVGKASFLRCERPAPEGGGTGHQARTLLFAPSGKGVAVAFDHVLRVSEDDPLEGNIGGVALEIEPTDDGIVLRDRDDCARAIAAVTAVARASAPDRSWGVEEGVYRTICARRGRYVLERGRFVRPAAAPPAPADTNASSGAPPRPPLAGPAPAGTPVPAPVPPPRPVTTP